MLAAINRLPIICLLSAFLFSELAVADAAATDLSIKRIYYSEAREALENNELLRYTQLKHKLRDYPLVAYLEYQELKRRLNTLPYADVDQFMAQHQHTYVGDLLLRHWLNQLAARQHWHEYRSYFDTKLTSSVHQCLFLWSRLQTGDKSAIDEVEALWNVGRSQPDECDAVFDYWKETGRLTKELVWQRYTKAILSNHSRLKRYLKRLMPVSTRQQANLFQAVLADPLILAREDERFQNPNIFTKNIVFHGLKKLIRKDADQAWILWQDYDSEYNFSNDETETFMYALAKRYGYDNRADRVIPILPALTEEQRNYVIEIVLREQLKTEQWQNVVSWLIRLPEDLRQSERWQYWLARSYRSLGYSESSYLSIYQALAQERNFYGFLAADFLGQDYQLQHKPTVIETSIKQSLLQNPAMIRAKELFLMDKLHDARQEWAYATQKSETSLSPEAHQAAAQMAYEWGWYRKSIESMAAASAWDDLTIRFPVAHQNIIAQQARQTSLPATLLFAIARQESAWEADATSSAGAMGLMQLMPQTARETARKAGIVHQRKDLFEPEHNIILGSRYIRELLERYDNNRVPAIAAYNAGPHRVNRWLQETNSRLDYDIWIEVIPFGETRKYVQNVLSYALVYARRTGMEEATLLTQIEIKRPL